MELKIITGRSKTGKSSYIYDEIGSRINLGKDENLLLIVPEQMTYQSEYEIIDRFKSNGIMNTEIVSFKRLAYKIFDEVGGLKLHEINSYGKVMLLKQIFDENMAELQVYKKASQQDGFLREFNSLIKELKENCISIEFIENILKYKINNELLKRKLQDIIKIYKSIELKTNGNYYDEEDKTDLFISFIDKSKYIQNSRIWIDNFDSFAGQRYSVIEKLIQTAKSVTVSLDLDPLCVNDLEAAEDWEVFKTTYDTLINLKDIAEKLGIKINITAMYGMKNISDEIYAVEKNMFTVSNEKYTQKVNDIQIYSSMNQFTETEVTAGKIISLVRDQDYRWRDIAIAVSDIDSYDTSIKKIFAQYEIPYFLDVKRDIMDNPLTAYILSVLDMFIWNFKHDSVFEYLKTGFSPMDGECVDKLENFALQYGIEGYKWFREFNFMPDKISYFEDLRQIIELDFKDLRKEFTKLKSAADITMFIFNLMKKHKVQEKIENQVEDFRREGLYEKAYENAQIWNVVIDVFEQITIAASDVQITPKQYRKILESGLREIEISIIPPTIDKVSVGGLDRSAVRKCRALFVIGANEGALEIKGKEKGILLDDEKDMLWEMGLKLPGGSNYLSNKGKHTLYKVISRPSNKLYISYALGTVEGRALQPSIYIDRLKQIFTELIVQSDLASDCDMDFVSNANGTVNAMVSKIRDYMEFKQIDDMWKDVYAWYAANDENTYENIKKSICFDNSVSKITEENIEKIYKLPLTLSVSKLESFAQCPFEFFVEAGLKPEPRKIQQIEFCDLGDIYHKSMEEFTNRLTGLNIEELEKDIISSIVESCTAKVLLEKEFENTALEANERNKYMKNKIKRLVTRAATIVIEQLKRSKFRPEYTELKIQGNATGKFIEPIEIKISEEQSVYLQGRIDRVDTLKIDNSTYVNIIDYKSSKKDIDLSDTVSGLQLQLFVYMSSIVKNGGKLMGSQPKVAGVYYFCIDDPIIDGDDLDGKTPDEEIFGKLSLNGYVLEDMEIIESMDNKIMETRSSDIIPVGLKNDGSLKKTSKTLTKEEYRTILNKVDKVSANISKQILNGEIDIYPYRKEATSKAVTPCSYCDYKSICQFDVSAKGNKYREIHTASKEQILAEIMIEGGNGKNGMD